MLNINRLDIITRVMSHLLSVSLILGLLCLEGCQTVPANQSTTLQTGHVLPPAAAMEKKVRYEILPDLSDVRFLVFRAGPLAKLGHNHVVQAKNIRGEILLARDIHQSSFLIEMPVTDFQVDSEEARLDEGEEFFPQPDSEAISGTTKNMLSEQVLDVAKFPMIEIKSIALKGPAWGMDITVRISMHGVEREIVVPTAIENNKGKLIVTAFFSINQTDFGIVPMSVLGGALQVDNRLKIRMRIVASRDDS